MDREHKNSYAVNSQKATQIIVSGAVASVAMVAVAYLLRLMGIPAPDFAAQYGAILNNRIHPEAFSSMWWMGLAWHSLNGILIFSFLYDYLVHRMILPSQRVAKGFLYGAGIWMFVNLAIAPLAGEGVFFQNMPSPFLYSFTAFICWLTYGIVLDQMTRVRIVHHLHLADKQAA